MRPFLEWRDLELDMSAQKSDSFVDRRGHVCLCDASDSSRCSKAANWHDLGTFEIDLGDMTWFQGYTTGSIPDKTQIYKTSVTRPDATGVIKDRRITSGVIGFGGDLLERYTMSDVLPHYPAFALSKTSVSRQHGVFKEFCAQRCKANALCVGFDYGPSALSLDEMNHDGSQLRTHMPHSWLKGEFVHADSVDERGLIQRFFPY